MMKRIRGRILVTLWVIFLGMSFVACAHSRSTAEPGPNTGNAAVSVRNTKMNIKIGSKVFAATLHDSETAEAFKKLLPLTIEMGDFNGNEKDHKFSTSFPTDASNPGTIKTGDLMIWGDSTLVLFYKSFRTSFSYTKLGKIDDPHGLEAAVGKGGVTVTFELDRSPKE